jgi:maleylacetoacetate isomerase
MKLYSYFRSSAAYRLRIALNLKGIAYDYLPVNLLKREQKAGDYLARNPQGLVPAMELPGGNVLGQSVALLEWLEETHPEPALLPRDALQRARVRSVVNSIACDVHPLCNIAVLDYLKEHHAATQDDINRWFVTWMHRGFGAIETVLAGNTTACAFGESAGMADVVLVPQVYNARRFDIPLDDFPRLVRVVDHCNTLPAFRDAAPENQPDSTL